MPESANRPSECPPDSVSPKEYYDSIAQEFEEMDDYWSNPYDTATWEMENSLVATFLAHSGPLLDLGAGFYPHVESTEGMQLVNVDLSVKSLRVARRLYHSRNPSMQYVCGDGLSLPFRDNAFGGVVAGGELVNHVSLDNVLREIHRVLSPNGRAVVSVAMKWCADSLFAVLDAFIGGRIGYSMTAEEARQFLIHPMQQSDVTWEVTPDFDLRVSLYTRRQVLQSLRRLGFRVVHTCSLNVISGVIPLPLQQDQESGSLVRNVSAALLRADRSLAGRLPGLRWFAGNVYLVIER